MGSAISLRDDFDGPALQLLARQTMCQNQGQRPLSLVEIYDGTGRTAAVRIVNVGVHTVWDWIIRFNVRGLDGLLDRKAPCTRSLPNGAQRQALVEIVERGPIPAIHGVVRSSPEMFR